MHYLTDADLYTESLSGNNRPPVILDEIQHITELFPSIKIECNNSVHNGQFDLTGSQQFLTATAASALTGNLFETFIVSEILKSFCSLPAEYI